LSTPCIAFRPAKADKFVYNDDMEPTGNTKSPIPARERILQTAHTLFYRDGIRATGINRVIDESGVTKVTFYRHFPSKNDLILEFLAYRHQRWMAWFTEALRRHGGKVAALEPTLAEWFKSEEFRGCSFINSVGELGGELPAVKEAARSHKREMTDAIAALLPPHDDRDRIARALAIAVDGAIVHAQCEPDPEAALMAFGQIVRSLCGSEKTGYDAEASAENEE
jgi:AcrR family transcriptional regulator